MKRLPLSQLNIITHSNSAIQTPSFNNKTEVASLSCLISDNTQFKNENTIGFETSSSFQDLQPCTQGSLFERIDRDMESPLSSPKKSSSTKSSIIKKSIKKEKFSETSTKASKRLKAWLKLRQKKTSQAQGNVLSRQSSLNMTYKFTPKKLLSQIMSQEEGEQEFQRFDELEPLPRQSLLVEKENSSCTVTSHISSNQENSINNSRVDNSVDKNIYCLNEMPDTVKKVKISGISVFFGDDCYAYAFPSDKKTVKYVV